MKTLRIVYRGEREESRIVCRKHVVSSVLSSMREELLGGGGLVFTDSNVYRLYGRQLGRALGGVPLFVMEAGEEHKNEGTLFALLHAMAEAGLRRNSVLIALGGGVVGDIGGLAASLYMRGIGCIQIPTTLLAQVDSSAGGKTAIDLCGVKNLVGAFHQPRCVYVDPAFLKTLPPRELRCGLGEIVKHGVLLPTLFNTLCRHREDLLDPAFLSEIVPENIAFKADVVRRDPHEKDVRRCLNLGHTTAHALELSGAGLSHGECVLVGLVYEAHLAAARCGGEKGFAEKLGMLAESILGCSVKEFDVAAAARSALLDKKNTAKDHVACTLPLGVGAYRIEEIPFAEYEDELRRIRETL